MSFINANQKYPRTEIEANREGPHTEVPIMDPLDTEYESWEEIRGRKEKNRERREHEQIRNEMGAAWHPSAASYHSMKSSKPACECHPYPPPYYLIRGPSGEIVTQKRVGVRNFKFGKKPENHGDTSLSPDGFRYEHHCHQHDVHQIHVYRRHPHIPGSIEAVGGEKNIH